MRRSPEKDHRHHHQGTPGRRGTLSHGRPTNDRTHGTGDPTDDNVLRSSRLQIKRVEKSIEKDGSQREDGTQPVIDESKDPRSDHSGGDGKDQGVTGLHATIGQNPTLCRSGHQGITVTLQILVQRIGTSRRQKQRKKHQGYISNIIDAFPNKSSNASDQHQQTNRRFGQRQVILYNLEGRISRLRQGNILIDNNCIIRH